MNKRTIKKQNVNPLIEKYGAEKRWVNYSMVPVKGRITKVPFSPITRKAASSTDLVTWGTYDEAIAVNPKQYGIVFTPEQNLLGIDIDHCLEGSEIIHEQKQAIAELIIEADTYTEISPSGTGLHLYLDLSLPLPLVTNRHGNFEAYTSGRYFTVTGIPYRETRGIRTVTPEEALALLSIIGYPWGKTSGESAKPAKDASGQAALPTGEVSRETSDATPERYETKDILTKMFRSKGGEKIRALYQGDTSAYKGDGSSADMALVSHLAFWTGKHPAMMEAMWLASPLGAREKTQQRQDYRDRTIQAAIDKCREVYESKSTRQEKEIKAKAPDLELLFTLSRDKEKIFTKNVENMCRILRKHPEFAGTLRQDTFKNRLELKEADAWRASKDIDVIHTQARIQILFPMFGTVAKDMVRDAIDKVAQENEIDSAADYLRALKWDGTKRLDTWLSNTFHVEDTAYYRAVASNWLKGLVKRVMLPGCKFDYVLVLEGEQGTKKSTSLAVLGRDWHSETTMSTDSKDFFMQFEGKVIIEFSEGEVLSRTEIKKMKAIITTPVDKYRPAYGRLSIDHPRRCVFAMTTNQTEYLKDETGNRRWLPVACIGVADVEWLEANRDQLFAEAYQRVIRDGETIYEFPEEDARAMQDARRIQDPNTENVLDWFLNKLKPLDRENGVTVQQAYRDALNGGLISKPIDRFNEMNIADIFKTTLHLVKTRKMVDGMQSNRWCMTDRTPVKFISETPMSDFEQLTLPEEADEKF